MAVAGRSSSLQGASGYANSPPRSAESYHSRRSDSISNASSLVGSMHPPDGHSILEWVRSWDDQMVAQWLSDNKCGQYEQIFRENDIRGDVLLDVDQQALKEMSVQSVGDRIKIVVAIKKLRTACMASGGRRSMLTSSQSNSSLSTSSKEAAMPLSASDGSLKRSGSARNQQRIPPPLLLHQNTIRPGQPSISPNPRTTSSNHSHGSASSSGSFLSAPTSASSGLSPSISGSQVRRGSSPRQPGPPALSAPKSSLPPPPTAELPPAPIVPALRQRQPSANSTASSNSSQTIRPGKYQPAWPNSTKNPNHFRSGSLGHSVVPSATLPGRPSTANASSHQPYSTHPYANNSPTREEIATLRPAPTKAHGLSPINESFNNITAGLPPPAAQRQTDGYTVGRGGFSRPTTAAGTVSATASGLVAQQVPLEDLRRRTVKFTNDEGVGKTVDLDGARDASEIFTRVLRKFGKLEKGQVSHAVRVKDGESEAFIEMDGWGIFAINPEGQAKVLTEAELVAICFAANRPERQRGLILRKLPTVSDDPKARKFKNKLQHFFGEDVPAKDGPGGLVSPSSPTAMLDVRVPGTAIEPASPTPSSPSSGSGDHGQQNHPDYDQAQERRFGNKMNRASTVSVMSGLLESSYSSPGATRSPSLGGNNFLSGSGNKLRHFFGHRPPSELIASHLPDYFPSADRKTLNKTVRNSIRKSMRPNSQWSNAGSAIGVTSWDRTKPNTSRFSVSSAGSSGNLSQSGNEPPVPPLPAKDHYAAAAVNESRPLSDESLPGKPAIKVPDSIPGSPERTPSDDANLQSRSRSRQSMGSRMSSHLSVRTSRSGRDSDSASLLTVDEITAEVEHRRMSMSIFGADESSEMGDDDKRSVFSSGRKSSLGAMSSGTDEDENSIEEEDEEDEEESEDEDEDEDDEAENAAYQKLTSTGTKTEIKWIKGALIGAGSFGKVYLAMNAINGTLMAVKQVEVPSGDSHNESRKKSMLEALEREIELLKGLQHENIVQYLDSSSDEAHLNIFLEYVPGGSVVALLRNYGAFEEPLVRTFVRQILLGLNYLHEREIIHRDIKGANILVDNKGAIKISDFGISKKVEDNLLSNPKVHRPSLQGSIFWMSPEAVKQEAYTSKADIWSLGCVIIEMLTGSHPHVNLNQMQALFRIGTMSASPEIPKDITAEAQDFLKQTFLLDQAARPSATELLDSAFINAAPLTTPTASKFPTGV